MLLLFSWGGFFGIFTVVNNVLVFQNLLFFKELAEDEPCHVTNLNMKEAGIPYPEEIRALLSVSKVVFPIVHNITSFSFIYLFFYSYLFFL